MAQSKKTSNASGSIDFKRLRGLWKNITAAKLVELLQVKQPGSRWSFSGQKVTGCCPYHDDSNPSFSILLDRHFGKCFGCDTFVSNPVEFWAKITGLSIPDALGDLKQHFSLDGADATTSKLTAWDRNQRLKKALVRLAHDELVNAINEPNNPEYALAQPAVKYLIDVRKVPVESIPALTMFGVLPPLGRIVTTLEDEAAQRNELEVARAAEAGEKPRLETGLQDDAAAYLASASGWAGSVLFSLDRSFDTVARIKLRRPNSKEILHILDSFEEGTGFFGLTWSMYRGLCGGNGATHTPYVVEGEFDALSIHARQVQAGSPNMMVLSAGGSSGGAMIDELYHLGFNSVNLVVDPPAKNGDVLAKTWLDSVNKLHANVFCGHDLWPGAGDPDEAVVNHGLPAVEKVLLDVDNRSIFKTPPRWLVDGIAADILAVPTEQRRRRIEIASNAGKSLRNSNDSNTFVELCKELFDLPEGDLRRDISTHTDTEAGFVARIAEELARRFFVIGTKRDGNKVVLKLWHRTGKYAFTVALSDTQDIAQVTAPILGNIWYFFDTYIGVPEWLEQTVMSQKGGTPLQRKTNILLFFLKEAFTKIAAEARDCSRTKTLGPGIHRIDRGNDCVLYMVNGSDVYFGYYEGNVLKWRELEGPADDHYIFNVEDVNVQGRWARDIESAEDLRRATSVDLKAVTEKLLDILSIGWRFKHHEVTAKFLTYHLLATTVSAAFERKVIIGFHADTSSGKSKLLLGLIAGTQDTSIHLMEATESIGMGYTAAGFKQSMHEKSLTACVDEFEDDGSTPRSTSVIENIQATILRGLQTGNNVQRMGSKTGKATGYSLNFFVFLAAIHRAKNPQDANRVIQVSLEKVEQRASPDSVILGKYSVDELSELRSDLTIALLPHIRTLRDTYRRLDRELTPALFKNLKLEDRMKNGLLPALSVIDFLGGDAKQFLAEYCTSHSDIIASTGGRTDSKDIFDWVTQTPQIPVETNSGRMFVSFLSLLGTPESRASVNGSQTGLYFDEATKLLIVNWTMATQSVLRNNSRFAKSSSHQNLRELANRVAFAVKPDYLESSGALARVRKYGLHGVVSHHLTGYDVSHLLQPQADIDGTPEEKNATVITLPKKTNDANFG